jgi:hypothetical protein
MESPDTPGWFTWTGATRMLAEGADVMGTRAWLLIMIRVPDIGGVSERRAAGEIFGC